MKNSFQIFFRISCLINNYISLAINLFDFDTPNYFRYCPRPQIFFTRFSCIKIKTNALIADP